jgi:hypothetical protein
VNQAKRAHLASSRILAVIKISSSKLTAVVFVHVTSKEFDADIPAFVCLHTFAHVSAEPVRENDPRGGN